MTKAIGFVASPVAKATNTLPAPSRWTVQTASPVPVMERGGADAGRPIGFDVVLPAPSR